MPEMEGTFLDILRKYLEKEKIDFSFDVNRITISIEEHIETKEGLKITEKKELVFVESIENCEIIELYYQPGIFQKTDIQSTIRRVIPHSKEEILYLRKYEDKKDLEISMVFSMFEGPLDAPGGVKAGEVANIITIKDILKEPAKRHEEQIIMCRSEEKEELGIGMYCTLEN